MDAQEALLIDLLAETDSLFMSHRALPGRAAAALCEAQARFFAEGVLWRSGASDNAARIDAHRTLEICTVDGLVEVVRGQGRTTAARLTPRGDHLARSLAGGAILAEAIPALERIVELQPEAERFYLEHFRGGVPITRLAECDWDGPRERFTDVDWRLLPVLCRSIVYTRSSWRGHLWIFTHATAATLEALRAEAEQLAEIQFSEEALDAYGAALRSAVDRLRVARPHTPGLISPAPLPVAFARAGSPKRCHVHGDTAPIVGANGRRP